ncbi:PREDICTED: putative serine protease 47 [Capra hircus]|uniref:putative serine protease 47 n=1 Tax=Capra hircus TaxID=9925 RepID=UPI0008478900|nr:PREDICTED: putative serine protease 47 [Capra hircus]
MGGEAGTPQRLGQPAALLWLMLLNVATRELRGSPATAAPGPAAGDGGALTGGAPTWRAQRLAPGAAGALGPPFGPRSPSLQGLRAAGCDQGLAAIRLALVFPTVKQGELPGCDIWGTNSVSIVGGSRVSTVCGKSKVMGRIYGGRDVEAGQWPWQASLRSQGSHICGAVLINSSWLLSTAHCFLKKSKAPENYRVLLGSTQLYQHTPQTREVSVSRIITHPDFEKLHPFGSDIAMLQLLFPVNFTSYIIPACLPVPGMKLPSNSSCWITGWGMLNEESEREGKVSFIENKFCNMLYGFAKGKNLSVQEDMLCAADFSTGKSICQGDSGGPLVCDFIGSWVLMGLASWGFDCRHPIYPSIFTNVTYFTDWIEEIQRLTPHPEPMSALTPLPEPTSTPPQTQFPHQSLQAAASSMLGTAFGPPQTWPLLLFLLGSPRQTMW